MFGRRASCDPQPSTFNHSHFSLKRRLSLAHGRRPSTTPSSPPSLIVSASTFQPIAFLSTTTAPFQPPPTTNTLKAKERAELVRRTRKLEQVLGVAMHVVEAAAAGAGPSGKSAEEAPALSSPSAPPSAGAPNSILERVEIPDAPASFASAASSSPAHVPAPRRRLKSLRRPSPPGGSGSRPATAAAAPVAPPGGVLVSTLTQVHVDVPTETTVVVSPPPEESSLPWYCTPVNMDDDEQDASTADQQPDSLLVVRPKQPLVFSASASPSSQSLLGNDLQMPTTTTTTSTALPTPLSPTTHLTVVHSTVSTGRSPRGRDRSSSVTSTATLDSIASAATFTLPDPRQRQVHQALKLQRRLGETIPPELLQHPPTTTTDSSSDSSTKRRKVSHKPSLSLKLTNKKKSKPQTQDQVQIVVDPSRSLVELSPSQPRGGSTSSHRRVQSEDDGRSEVMKVRVVNSETDLPSSSRSPSRGTDWTSTIATLPPAWASDVVLPRRAKSHDEESERKHLLGESPTTSAARMSLDEGRTRMMSASEKRLNVRRAQKMTKKFGQAPPHTLFQITTNHENASSTRISINIDLDLTSPTTSLRRHSTTTTYTISVPRSPAASSTWSFHAPEDESNNADAQATTPTAARRRSSMGSFMGLGDGSGSATSLSRVKTIPSPILVEFPAAAKEGAGQVVSPTTSAPVVTPTTPKASNSVARRKRTLSGSKSQSAFATKRRQATKLTKFFGVEYPDLYQAMVTTTTTTTTTTTFTDAEEKSKSGSISGSVPEKKPHYQKASATRIRKSSDTAPPTAYKHKKRKSVVAAALSSTGSASDSASLRVGVDDSCRWSAKGPEEVEELMAKLRSMKA